MLVPMLVTKSMINNHIDYLHKFGSIRIKDYAEFLLNKFDLSVIEKAYVRQLPEYYKTDCPRMTVFIDIMIELNLWYSLYL